jgi:phosphoribosylanthranilate isomerase
MPIDAKICGLTDRAGLEAALAGGARYIGLVFFAKSPRNVTLDQAAALAAQARGRAEIVAVTVDADEALLTQIAARVSPDWLQLHGEEPPGRMASLRRFAQKGLIKAIPIARSEDFASVGAYGDADWLLFDAKAPPSAALPGGNGAAFDWRLLQGRAITKPWFLSGGLNIETIATAISESGARTVDVSSGVETAPGLKNPDKITRFLAAVRAA